MNSIRATQKLNQRELDDVIPPSASWHRDYDDTAFIYIGGLHLDLSEGDVITIFSQYGEPVFINLVRDKDTGKSKGFCFLKYEDQRSCALAVDNLGGATVLGRVLRVDHTRYKKKDDEEIFDNTNGETAPGGAVQEESESEEEVPQRPMLKEEKDLAKLLRDEDDDDPMKAYLIQQKREEVELARAALEKKERKSKKYRSHKLKKAYSEEDEGRESRRHRHRSRSPRREKERSRERRRREPSKTPVYGD